MATCVGLQQGIARLTQAGVAGIGTAGLPLSDLSRFLAPPGERNGPFLSVVARGVGHSDVTNVPHHEVGGEGVLGDEEDGTLRVHVQRDAGLTIRTVVHLGGGGGWIHVGTVS